MTQKVEAIYTGGVLKPTRELPLKDEQRVRLTVETIDEPVKDRQAAIARCGRASGTERGRASDQATRTCIRSVETISGSRQRPPSSR